jgi:hypothetical protein
MREMNKRRWGNSPQEISVKRMWIERGFEITPTPVAEFEAAVAKGLENEELHKYYVRKYRRFGYVKE